MKRLEYRGYDSAGVALDFPSGGDMALVKTSGKVAALEAEIKISMYDPTFILHIFLIY